MYRIQYLFNILSYKILETYRIKVSYFLVKNIKSSLCSLSSVCLLLIKYVWLSFQHFILCTFNVVKYLQESLQCEVFASVSASDVSSFFSSFFSSQGQFPLLIIHFCKMPPWFITRILGGNTSACFAVSACTK